MNYIIGLILAFTLISCQQPGNAESGSEASRYQIKSETVPSAEFEKNFPEGNYYYFQEAMETLNPKETLNSLLDNNIIVTEAWFQQGANSCGMLQVIVPSYFLIKTKEKQTTEKMAQFEFKEVSPASNEINFANCENVSITKYSITKK